MWKNLFNIAKWLFTLQEKVELHDRDIKEVRQEMDRLSRTVEELRFEMRGSVGHERQEREKILLSVENALLRFERRLPPPKRS